MTQVEQAVQRLLLDVDEIYRKGDRTGAKADKVLRWEGEPNGWRTMGDLAEDIRLILGQEKTNGDQRI